MPILLLLLLLVFLVVLHVRSKGRRCVVTPVAYCALEWFLVVVRLHVNFQVVTAIKNQFEHLEVLRICLTPFCSLWLEQSILHLHAAYCSPVSLTINHDKISIFSLSYTRTKEIHKHHLRDFLDVMIFP